MFLLYMKLPLLIFSKAFSYSYYVFSPFPLTTEVCEIENLLIIITKLL
jgi:hypothetical protein